MEVAVPNGPFLHEVVAQRAHDRVVDPLLLEILENGDFGSRQVQELEAGGHPGMDAPVSPPAFQDQALGCGLTNHAVGAGSHGSEIDPVVQRVRPHLIVMPGDRNEIVEVRQQGPAGPFQVDAHGQRPTAGPSW